MTVSDADAALVSRRACEIDAGFDLGVLADMIDMLGRFTDAELPPTRPTN